MENKERMCVTIVLESIRKVAFFVCFKGNRFFFILISNYFWAKMKSL